MPGLEKVGKERFFFLFFDSSYKGVRQNRIRIHQEQSAAWNSYLSCLKFPESPSQYCRWPWWLWDSGNYTLKIAILPSSQLQRHLSQMDLQCNQIGLFMLCTNIILVFLLSRYSTLLPNWTHYNKIVLSNQSVECYLQSCVGHNFSLYFLHITSLFMIHYFKAFFFLSLWFQFL